MEWQKGEYTLSTDRARLEFDTIHYHLSEVAYWSLGIPRATLERAFANSLCFGIYKDEAIVGWARVVTDYATYGYLADVYVLPEYRGQGLSKWLMQCIIEHPDLQGLRRWTLATRDAHNLYAQYGFKPFAAPDRWMERHDPDVYKKAD